MERVFIFNGYDLDLGKGRIDFHYVIRSQNLTIEFIEKLTFPNADFSKVPQNFLQKLLQNLSLIIGISYWKLYCPKKIELKNNFLTKEQVEFWNAVYTKGLGEFFYRKKIDFRGLVQFPYHSNDTYHYSGLVDVSQKDRSLLMLGGGKDSIVAAELLKESKKEFTAFIVNDYPLQREIIKILNEPYSSSESDIMSDESRSIDSSRPIRQTQGRQARTINLITVRREIDQKLLEFNKRKDTYNGHIPISAIYAFIALLAAAVYDYRYIISSNEASANYGNTEYLGETVNHQWSKSFEFEQMFAEYVKKYLTSNIYYFSLLRSLYEIKIAQLFSKHPKYFSTFSSCNRNFALHLKGARLKNRWCGKCPKCAFIFATLAAFLPKDEVIKIFGKNLFADESLIDIYKELLGIKNVKPFECVGTPEEVRLAFYLVYKKGEFHKDSIMQMFLKKVLVKMRNIKELELTLLSVSSEHLILNEFNNMLILQ